MKSSVIRKVIVLLVISVMGIFIISDSGPYFGYSRPLFCTGRYGLFLFNTSSHFYSYFIEIKDGTTVAASPGVGGFGLYEAIYNDEIENFDQWAGFEECFVKPAKISMIKQKMKQVKDTPNPFLTSIYADTWAGVLLCGNKQIAFILSDHADDDIGEVVKMLTDVSPIPIKLYSYGNWPVPEHLKN